ncbi:fimbria/pilus outer membrane usher protein [Novosphingobium sp. SL115]|uniref:fimbria/pilus outer membrane usher protein n=1 Tax=Novosphingobium sp. SL115 TaxID=2995150 RepID=UPI002272EE62|nr:fimbria/pilus outer membrane usher protein [Novosphingobium sp. SL115]MCY1669426.1 fimbria/pilus outer membrane usher protein [Novosphingobium sp. SL115]
MLSKLHICTALAVLALSSPVMAQADPTDPQPVGLILNGMATAEPGLLVIHDGRLLARVEDLRQLGIEAALTIGVLPIDGQDYVELGGIAGLSAQFDAEQANLKISASPEVFPHLAFAPQDTRIPRSPILPAQFLGYDLALSSSGAKARISGLLDAGLSGKWGVLGSTFLLTGKGLHTARLDTSFRREFPDQRLRLVLGDTVSRPGPGGQALRFGGFQFGTDFGLDPQAINFPLPVVGGSTALPSTVELLSQAQRQSYDIAPGAFDVALQPRMTGAGQVTMNIRDVAGNSRQVVRNFYTSADLLRPGLTDFNLEAGALRQDFGAASNHYGAFFAAVGVRHPLASWFTAQARVETSADASVIGFGGSFVAGALGEVSAVGSLSAARGKTGHVVRVQARRSTPTYSLSASVETTSRDFQSLGQSVFQTGARREIALAASASLGRAGGINLAHALLEEGGGTPSARSFSMTSASYNGNVLGGGLGAGVQRTSWRSPDRAGTSWSLFASYTIALGPRTRVSQFAETGRLATTFDMSLPDGPGYGLRGLVGEDRGAPWLEGALAVRTAAGDFGLQANKRGEFSGIQATASGAIVRVGDTMLATPRLDYAFALIDVASDETVTVMVENRELPRQAGGGRKVIATGLQPYAPNHIGIDASSIAIDAALISADALATPGWRQAAVVHFGDSGRQPASFRLVDTTGRAIPVGATLRSPTGTGIVGYDGEVWMDDHTPGDALIVMLSDRQCRSFLPATSPASAQGQIPRLLCEPYIETEAVL